MTSGHEQAVDLAVFLPANLYNLFLSVVFLACTRAARQLERGIGFLGVLLGAPLLAAVLLNAIGQR